MHPNSLLFVSMALVLFVLTGCEPTNEQKSQIFFDEVKSHFEQVGKPTHFNKFVGQGWDEVCFFRPANSDPNSGRLVYEDYLARHSLNDTQVSKKNFNGLLVLRRGSYLQEFYFEKPYVNINKVKYWLSIKNDDTRPTGGCINGEDALIKADEFIKNESGYLVIFEGKGI